MRAGLMQPGDDVGKGLAHARYFTEAALLNHLAQWQGQHAEALGRAAEDRGRGEDADTHEQEPRAAEESAEPAAGR